jgi:hypothetical protein
MKGHGAKLPRKQEAAIGALLSSRNIEEAAKTTGVSASTLRRMRLPEFESDYLRARREGVTQAYARLQQNSNVAGTLLLKLLVGSKDSTKLQAAKCILELSRKALDTEDILLRLERLEEHVKSKT